MKKNILRILAVGLASCVMVACASGSNSSSVTANSQVNVTDQKESMTVVTTVFPIYDWTKQILGEDAEDTTLIYLENSGADVHSYEPNVSDMVNMTTCDMFIYVGGESDTWVNAVLANSENPDMVVINLMETLGDSVKEEAEVEGMQEHDHDHDEDCDDDHDHDHDEDCDDDHDNDHDEDCDDDHDHDHDEDCDDDHDHDYDEDCDDDHDEDCDDDHDHEEDEHVWLSLRNAATVCQVIANELSALNPAKADLYANNVANYLTSLNDLDAEYQATVDQATQNTLLFADRFPFLYMMEDYGLNYYAAFAGCSSETEASFETIAFLSGKIDELDLSIVLTTEDPAPNVAQTIISNAKTKDQSILALDSMQAVTAAEVDAGETYLGIMERNLEVLAQAVQ